MALASGMRAPTGRLPRLLAVLVCALALGLLAWRANTVLTRPGDAAPRPAAEAALADMLSPIAGPGLSRLSITYNAEGGRTVLVLLDASATARIPDIERIVPLAAGLVPDKGDRLVIETAAFATGLPGRPDAAAWAELAVLAVLALMGAALSLMPGQAAPAPLAQLISPSVSPPPERVPDAPRPVRAVPAPVPADAAADIARRDPARAAAVVRSWMRAKDDVS